MRLEVLVEEPSAEEALRLLLPGLLRGRACARIINLGSKYTLLKVLPDRLAAYRMRIDKGEDLRIIVLADRDTDDCACLKKTLERMAANARLPTKTCPEDGGRFYLLNRIVIEELESWFIGDPAALRAAFQSLPPLATTSGIFRNPDNGGTWEALHRFFKKHGIYRGSYPKIDAARKIARHLDPARNRSSSFRCFCQGLDAILA
ncbi:MAG: hypothetical protein BWK76_10170 [Desulfobulbaceae bacterium A2]|nr:MAG: hypothetical protein BWK76_10170 [Desulfobulbaceae bacterium A2]